MVTMRDGTEVEDVRLGRLPLFDPRSRDYPVMAAVKVKEPRSYTWSQQPPVVDQGPIGACVAFGTGNEALGRPGPLAWPTRLTREFLLDAYCAAQRIDPWPGTDEVCRTYGGNESPFYGGTAGLAGLKVFRDLGFFAEFRWAFGVEEAVIGVGRNGPAMCGTWWRADMGRPDSAGRVAYSGEYQGGHWYVICGVDVSGVDSWLDGQVRLRNSWGPGWGDDGEATLSVRDWGRALEEQGECAFAQRRTWKPAGLVG